MKTKAERDAEEKAAYAKVRLTAIPGALAFPFNRAKLVEIAAEPAFAGNKHLQRLLDLHRRGEMNFPAEEAQV